MTRTRSIGDEQFTLERAMDSLGRERFNMRVAEAKRHGRVSDTVAGRRLMRESLERLEAALRAWLKRVKRMRGGNATAMPALSASPSKQTAMLALRVALDSAGRDNNIASAGYAIGAVLEDEARYRNINRLDSRVWRDLRRRLKHSKRSSARRIVRDVVGKLGSDIEPWTKRDKMRAGVVMLELIRQSTGLIELRRLSMPRGRVKVVVSATRATLEWLEKSNEASASMFPFWLPMLEQPEDWVNPLDGGYKTNLVRRRPIVKTRDRALLNEMASVDMLAVYGGVNALQRTPWRVNKRVLGIAKAFWDAGISVGGLPARTDEPLVPRPIDGAPEDDVKLYRREAAMRHQRVVAAKSGRVAAARVFQMAERFACRQPFYFPYGLDFRGRAYPVPFFMQPQGPSIARGLLEFADGLPLEGEGALNWWAVHGANSFGADKLPLVERERWVLEHRADIMRVAADPIAAVGFWGEADRPWEFLAWCLEFGDYARAGGKALSRLPIAMDGSNNGLQIFSLLMRDEVGAEATNCADNERPRDIYQDVADVVTERLVRESLRAGGDPLAAQMLEFVHGRVPRAATKRAVMTLPYGSTFHSAIQYTRDWYEAERKSRGGGYTMERGYKPANFLARHIWAAIGDTVGSARRCMDWLRAVADLHTDAGLNVRWTAPSGFIVKQAYFNFSTREVKTAVGHRTRWTKYREDEPSIDRRKAMNGVSPNFVHSLDAAALMDVVNRCTAQGIEHFATVHDSFATHAANAPKMALAIREAYATMFKDDLLVRFRDEVSLHLPSGTVLPPIPECGGFDVDRVLRSKYFFA
jgi:DNA-directed RNA polymerase